MYLLQHSAGGWAPCHWAPHAHRIHTWFPVWVTSEIKEHLEKVIYFKAWQITCQEIKGKCESIKKQLNLIKKKQIL